VNKEVENWLKIARYDLKAAEFSLQNGLYMKVYENSHSALEKLLKGIISANNLRPEKVHDLLRLASQAVIENLQIEVKAILDELNTIYFSTRYPEDFDLLVETLNKEKTETLLKEVRKIFSWLEKKIT